MRSTKIKTLCSSSLWKCLHHMVILRSQNKITDFLMILAWASPFKMCLSSCRPADRWPPSKQDTLNQRRVNAGPA